MRWADLTIRLVVKANSMSERIPYFLFWTRMSEIIYNSFYLFNFNSIVCFFQKMYKWPFEIQWPFYRNDAMSDFIFNVFAESLFQS